MVVGTVRPEVTNGPFLSHKGTEQERRRAGNHGIPPKTASQPAHGVVGTQVFSDSRRHPLQIAKNWQPVVSIGHLASSVPHTVRLCVKSERSVTSGLANDAKGKGTSSEPARPKVPMRRTGADSSVIARKRSNARGAKGAGHRRWERANWQQEEPPFLDGRRRSSLGGTSRMMREYHVRICERLGVKLSGPTRHGVVFVH